MEKRLSLQQNTVNTVKAKNDFNRIVVQITESRQPMIVEKRGTPVAVILDYESYAQMHSESQAPHPQDNLVQRLRDFHKHLLKKYPKGTGDSVEILHQMRAERHK